jgi:hypothetical protein
MRGALSIVKSMGTQSEGISRSARQWIWNTKETTTSTAHNTGSYGQRPTKDVHLTAQRNSATTRSSQIADFFSLPGQRSKDSSHLLQGQRLQEAHSTQSHTVQGGKGEVENAQQDPPMLIHYRPQYSPKESADTIANNPVMVVRRSLCFTRRPRQQRRSC